MMFEAMEVIFPIFFIVVLGVILVSVFKNVSEWSNNNQQSVLTVPAKIVSKRTQVSKSSHGHNIHHNNVHDHNNVHHHHSTSHSSYFVTFEVESGDRMELQVKDREYGLLAEGDQGKLTFQGTRYHNFVRDRTQEAE